MASSIIFICRIIIISEGVVGLIINGLVVALLWVRKCRAGSSTYRIEMTFSALHLALLAALGTLAVQVHIFNYQNYILVNYGLIAYLPRVFNDIVVLLIQALIIGIFEFIPASCILQYLALCKPYLSDAKRIIISYSLSVALLCFSMPHYTVLFGPLSKRAQFENITRLVHGLEVDDVYYVNGATLYASPPSNKAIIDIMLFAVIPPYTIAYLVFIVCCAKISRMLNSFGIKLSAKTLSMQRSFLKMMLMQALLPLLMFSLPIGLVVMTMLSNVAMDRQTLVLSFCVWALPSIQGGIALKYVNGIGVSSSRSSQKGSKPIKNTT